MTWIQLSSFPSQIRHFSSISRF
ncbi:MAG: hypothetical protein RL565_390, partial [Pseudomonadota bacterium]